MSSIEVSWTKALLSTDGTIRDAIGVLNRSSLRIVLVVNQQGILEGTISDGDIRRGLLKGFELDMSINLILHKDALAVPPEMGRKMVMQLMIANKIQQIPIVDDRQCVIGLHVWDELSIPVLRPNTLVIMAGGRGARLMPLTESCPKPLIQVKGKPILEHIIERAREQGFSNFVLAIHYLGQMIESYFGDGAKLGVKIEYLREEKPLGTAGALSLLRPLPKEPFIVTNGDVLTNINYGEMLDFHSIQSASGTMAVRSHEWQNPFGVVQTQGIDITGYEEKPIVRSHINAGVYVLDPHALELIPQSQSFNMPSLFEILRNLEAKIVAYPIHEQWLDVGRPPDLLEAELDEAKETKEP